MAERVVPWREVTPLEPLNGGLPSLLATVDTLRSAWQRTIETATREEFAEGRRRSLRRHAIETGIIERLYDVSWGVTEALVAEGLTLEAAEVQGSINPATLAMIQSQFDALEHLAEVARGTRPLTVQLIRELHQLITRHQATYEATDQLGGRVGAALHHGEWKRWPNHVRRSDGSVLQYAPPEQVQQQVEGLVELHRTMDGEHPVVRAAWLHHRFICIHPFEDGNGRTARALVLLDLLRANYAPLVVDRTRRDEYLAALDAANDGDLGRLVRLFAELEIVALRSELHQPVEAVASGSAVSVAHAYAARIKDLRRARDEERQAMAEQLAAEVHARLRARLGETGDELRAAFREVDPNASYRVYASSGEPRATYWRYQLIRAAREANFWTNLTGGTWWARLSLTVLDRELRYVAAIQRVGAGVGVMALTVFAETPQPQSDDAEAGEPVLPVPLIRLTSTDSVTIVGGQVLDDVLPEAEALIDRTLAVAVHEFGRQLN
jgi:fido (protein-threonine AMPylation protein)